MRCMVITRPELWTDEGNSIAAMLGSGVIERVHIRKPGLPCGAMRSFIESIPSEFHSSLSLHDCHELALEYGAGIHINTRNPQVASGFKGTISQSCHSIEEASPTADYHFLSPVFDSISKTGYRSAFNLDSLSEKINSSFIALGGVRPDKLAAIAAAGFGGAAFLGYIWNGKLSDNLQEIKRAIKECY